MKVFNECKKYEDYLNIIKDSIDKGIKYYDFNKDGYSILTEIKDEKKQNKIIKIMKIIDSNLADYNKKNNQMNVKINFFLSLGILSTSSIFDKLSPTSIYTLIVGSYSSFNNYNIKYLEMFSNEELLNNIYNKKLPWYDMQDVFFMIERHFDKEEVKDYEKFRKDMINKINSDTLHDGVMNMIEFWNSPEQIEERNKIIGGR